MSGRLAIATSAAIAALLLWAPPAPATFHLMSIREVYPGSAAAPAAEYVELQMWAEGQNLVAGHLLRTYDATGSVTGTNSFPADVPRGSNQSTMVLATPEAEAQFGFLADTAITPSGQLDPGGGAVCWEQIDCVAWGNFSGSLPSPAGSPAAPAGIPDGMALRRTIAPGCATLLEPGDDRDSSATDFVPAFPAPRPNAVAPSERPAESAVAASRGRRHPEGARPRPRCERSHRAGPATAPRPSASPPTRPAPATNAGSTAARSAPAAHPSLPGP
jgi:hypothetical protein